MSSEDTRIKDRCYCPGCGTKSDGHMEATNPDDDMPSHGDISICAYCGTISKFDVTDDVRTLSELTEPERKRALQDPGVVRALEILKLAHARAGK